MNASRKEMLHTGLGNGALRIEYKATVGLAGASQGGDDVLHRR